MLHDWDLVPRLDTETTLALALEAGWSREAAEKLARDRGADRLRRGEEL
jgi:hypothetical protein